MTDLEREMLALLIEIWDEGMQDGFSNPRRVDEVIEKAGAKKVSTGPFTFKYVMPE